MSVSLKGQPGRFGIRWQYGEPGYLKEIPVTFDKQGMACIMGGAPKQAGWEQIATCPHCGRETGEKHHG